MNTNENPYASPTFGGDQVEEVATKPNKSLHLASLWQRFAGSLIDSLILIVVIIPFFIAIMFLAETIYPGFVDSSDTYPILLFENMLTIIVMAVAFLLVNGYLMAKRGQTIGKLIMKTRIVSDGGELLPLPRLVLMRYPLIWCVSVIPVVGGFVNLCDPLAIFRGIRKCLHDDWAGTKVVTKVRKSDKEPLPNQVGISDIETPQDWHIQF